MMLPAWLRAPSWLAVGIAVALTYVAGRMEGGMAEREQQAERQAHAVLAAGHAYREQVAALQVTEAAALRDAQAHTRAAHTALDRADSLQVVADSLAKVARGQQAAQTASGGLDPCGAANRALEACQATGVALRETVHEQRAVLGADSVALVAVGQRADVAERRVGTVEQALRDLLATHECRFLWFRCPSRTVLFVAGVFIGGGAILALHP